MVEHSGFRTNRRESCRLSITRARAEHRPIVKAILKRDGPAAERTMRAHIRSTKKFIVEVAAERLGIGSHDGQ